MHVQSRNVSGPPLAEYGSADVTQPKRKFRRSRWKRLKLKWKMPVLIGLPTIALMLAVVGVSYY